MCWKGLKLSELRSHSYKMDNKYGILPSNLIDAYFMGFHPLLHHMRIHGLEFRIYMFKTIELQGSAEADGA